MKNTQKKALAQELYVRLGKTQKQIAEQVGVTEKTIGRWKEDGNWEALRAAEISGPEELARTLYREIMKISQNAEGRTLTSAEADQISKISTAIEKIQRRTTLGTVMEVMEEFVVYVKAIDIDLAQRIVTKQMDFLNMKAKEMTA